MCVVTTQIHMLIDDVLMSLPQLSKKKKKKNPTFFVSYFLKLILKLPFNLADSSILSKILGQTT